MEKIKFEFTIEEVRMIRRAIMTEFMVLTETPNPCSPNSREETLKEYDRLYGVLSTELGKALEGK